MQAQEARSAAIDLAATPPVLFGDYGEKACGWFDSSLALREGLEVSELSDRELLSLWCSLKMAPALARH